LGWTIEYDAPARKQLRKLDKADAKRIVAALDAIADLKSPQDRGVAMVGNYAGYWRYRIGNYRVIARIEDGRMVIVVVAIGHRREVYR
jgi:mRNA interferase RelE/StbE